MRVFKTRGAGEDRETSRFARFFVHSSTTMHSAIHARLRRSNNNEEFVGTVRARKAGTARDRREREEGIFRWRSLMLPRVLIFSRIMKRWWERCYAGERKNRTAEKETTQWRKTELSVVASCNGGESNELQECDAWRISEEERRARHYSVASLENHISLTLQNWLHLFASNNERLYYPCSFTFYRRN